MYRAAVVSYKVLLVTNYHELSMNSDNARSIRVISEIRGDILTTNNSNRTNSDNARNIRVISEIRGEKNNSW